MRINWSQIKNQEIKQKNGRNTYLLHSLSMMAKDHTLQTTKVFGKQQL